MPRLIALVATIVLAAGCQKATHIEVEPKDPMVRTKFDSVQLIARVYSRSFEMVKERVTWSSADPAIAVVDEMGRVSGKAGGRTKIIATYQDGLTATVPVEVAFVGGLKSDTADIALSYDAGDPAKPKVEVVGYDGRIMKDRSPFFRSANDKVCRVDGGGQVWPGDKGETTITATLDEFSVQMKCVVGK